VTTDREPSRESLAIEFAACGLLQTSDDGTIRRANQTFCTWLGRAPEAVVGHRFQDFLTMGGRIFHQTHWAPLVRMQGSISEVKLDLIHSDGTTLPMVLNALRRDENGTVVHELAAFVARDRDKYERELVLSRKRLQELVNEANQLHADAKDRALFAEQMIGIVSHDLRNPLATIAMGSALLARERPTPTQERILSKITRATDRANRLIGDLLDFTQARLGKGLRVSTEPIDLHAVVEDALDELSLAHPARTLEHVRAGDGEGSGDANRLAQMIGNLVSNAVVYSKPETPITVTSTIDAASFSIAVHNEGVPIPAEIQESLFRPMTRGTKDISKRRSVGLGLFIVREIARAHGGSAFVESTAESGTTFTAVFPRRSEAVRQPP
jgi:sigma-B regulation protein RsbU (phosphoserine phosphatase)